MQKISRIYLGNCGFSSAWYDGLMFNLTDPDTSLPTDTIINLENGGGKTTLLSLIFSCFETAQDRFLKHIQSKNNHFSQYFPQDGLPGFILVEWLMPGRGAGGSDYRLVVGQTVSIRAAQGESDRVFFSFEERSGLGMHDVPAPKLTMAPVSTMADFNRWLHDKQSRHPGDFYYTRTQAEWHRHLRDERQIDLDMLRMQVNFSAQEGGFDTGFLNFTSESEFLRKFFSLTLDAERAAAVRDGVATTADKIRRRPYYLKSLAELTKFQGVMTAFGEAAQAYQRAQAEELKVTFSVTLTAQALKGRADARRAESAKEDAYQDIQRQISVDALKEELLHTKLANTLTSLWHQRQVSFLKDALTAAESNCTTARDTLRFVKAARLQAEIDTQTVRVKELDEQAVKVAEGLKPSRAQLERKGTALRWTLSKIIGSLKNEIDELKKSHRSRQATYEECKKTEDEANKFIKQAANERGGIKATENRYQQERKELVTDELIKNDTETAKAAEIRWQQCEQDLLRQVQRLEALRKDSLNQALVERQNEINKNKDVAALGSEIKTLNVLLAEGLAERERLSQLPILQVAAESDVVDPESPALLPCLKQMVEASAREVSLCDIRLAELGATRSAIAANGVAGVNPDVAMVLECLHAANVHSARSFKQYISQAIPDAAKARALVMSDPARFSGVSVAESEMAVVRTVKWPKLPFLPVVISPVALDIEPGTGNRVVVEPDNDASYNREAAAALALTLEDKIAAEEKRRDTYSHRQTEGLKAIERLNAFLNRHGPGQRQQLIADIAFKEIAQRTASDQAEEAKAKAKECDDQADHYHTLSSDLKQQVQTAAANAKRLNRFAKELEDNHPQRIQRLAEIDQGIRDAEESITTSGDRRKALDGEADRESRRRSEVESQLQTLSVEHRAITFYDDGLWVHSEALDIGNLQDLRETYRDGVETYSASEKNLLGVLQAMLESARQTKQAKESEFLRDFSGVTPVDMIEYKGIDHNSILPGLESAITDADKERSIAMANEKIAAQKSREWHEHHRDLDPVTPDMEALDETTLLQAMARAEETAKQANERHTKADEEAKRAHGRAQTLLNTAKEDDDIARILRSSMGVDELPDPGILGLELRALTGSDPIDLPQEHVLLEGDAKEKVHALIEALSVKKKLRDIEQKKTNKAFACVQNAAGEKDLQDVEPEMSRQMRANDFALACADVNRLLAGLADRIGVTKDNIDKMKADFENCVEEINNIAKTGLGLLNSATNKRVPQGAPHVAGKHVLKMGSHMASLPADVRRTAIEDYLDRIIVDNYIPKTGSDLLSEVIIRMSGKPLKLQVLKMVKDETQQYVAIDKITNSGGEGVVMAMFLYVVISQLRAETHAKAHKNGGGPLILDNPFAKATSPTMWRAQRLLARAMGVQLIFATAIQDYNALGEFECFIRLRQAGRNTKTQRTHLEFADFKLNELPLALASR